MKRIDSLIGKYITKFKLEKDKLTFKTLDGGELIILASEQKGWMGFYYARNKLILEGHTVESVFYWGGHVNFQLSDDGGGIFEMKGIKKILSIEKENDGCELCVTIEIYGYEKGSCEKKLYYFKGPFGWKLSHYLNDMNDFHVQIAEKNDIINDKIVRLKTLV